MVEDLSLFQARKQVILKQFLKRKFGVHFPLFFPYDLWPARFALGP